MGLATGGNKTLKLEYLLGDARSHRADTLLAEGGVQSSHYRETAAAAGRAGMERVSRISGLRGPRTPRYDNFRGDLGLRGP